MVRWAVCTKRLKLQRAEIFFALLFFVPPIHLTFFSTVITKCIIGGLALTVVRRPKFYNISVILQKVLNSVKFC